MKIKPLLITSSLALTVSALPSAMAREDTECSNATLEGTYLFAGDGWIIQGSERKPFAGAGIERFDGHGASRGIYSISIDGEVTRKLSYTTTYTVNPDCTAEQVFTDENGTVFHFDLFIAPSGEEYSLVQTDPGFIAAGFEHRGARRVQP